MAIELLNPTQIDDMRPAGRFVADVLTTLVESAEVGTDLLELDALAHRMIKERGAESCYIDYAPSFGRGPFGKVLCTSVNDAVLHGLPHRYRLKDGDLISFDFAVSVDGWVCDSAVSAVVGTPRDEDLRLIETTETNVKKALGNVSHVIDDAVRSGKVERAFDKAQESVTTGADGMRRLVTRKSK